MRLRLLFTIGLVLCLSKFGSPNECTAYRKAVATKDPKETPIAHPAAAGDANTEYSTLLIPKLLYI
jgi:hypothetical protein